MTARETDLQAIVSRLVDLFHPSRIYLFGSTARGDEGPESDLDLMVVVDDSPVPALQREMAACRALCGIRSAADVLVWTRREFDARLSVPSSLPATILREGKLLHAA